MKRLVFILLLIITFAAKGQRVDNVDSIYFNLYTDSLKKGVYNYINVDGKLSSGLYQPLMTDQVEFKSSAGRWEGNSIIIERDFKIDSVTITASLKDKPSVKKTIVIYVKKIEIEPELKSEKELFDEWQRKGKKKKNLA